MSRTADRAGLAEALLASAAGLAEGRSRAVVARAGEAEGGCGVVGVAAGRPVPGRALIPALEQMRNRGNGKGGGIAAAGLDPAFLGVPPAMLREDYLLAVAYLDPEARAEVEPNHLEPTFEVDHTLDLGSWSGEAGGDPSRRLPAVRIYLGRVRPDVRRRFMAEHGIPDEHAGAAEDEVVFQNSFRLNRELYVPSGAQRAFVLSHGRDLLVLKVVGYGEDVLRDYALEDLRARVWIGHHRYPTKGRVWHPGGAHPFIGLHEALVHNGDFANYAAMTAYLAQRNRFPLFLTDTEVAALLFDLLHRVYGYPLELVIEALAPTTERDFALLPEERRRIYRLVQAIHLRGSPDGPWFFLIAQAAAWAGEYRLIGITDTSMLRPQVFALQEGASGIGLAASEKQAIDAVLATLAGEDSRYWGRADRYWNARGGSHTDGGAFVFTVAAHAGHDGFGPGTLTCSDKFGRVIRADPARVAPTATAEEAPASSAAPSAGEVGAAPATVPDGAPGERPRQVEVPQRSYAEMRDWLAGLVVAADDEDRERGLAVLTDLLHRRQPFAALKRSAVLALVDDALLALVEATCRRPTRRFLGQASGVDLPGEVDPETVVLLDARGFPPDGHGSLARAIVRLHRAGARRLAVFGARGHRFLAAGLGPRTQGMRIDAYGSTGDYLASGLDGAEVVVHGSAQDQVGQILKDGRLVIHGDVGQTFLYAAKGGDVFVLGNAAGRPLINAVGRPRVVINGTCLDYLAESFMAGDPLNGGGFAILNGLGFGEDGEPHDLDTPYPGGNLFSLASGGAIYIRDPRRALTADQLNGGEFVPLAAADWAQIRPYLEENERLFAIPLSRLLSLDGEALPPEAVYRKIRPTQQRALSPEEAWVRPQ